MKETDCIFFQFAKANQLAGKFLGQKVSALNVTSVQAMVLAFLNEEDLITSAELGKRTELDSATLTGILDRLAAAALIERQENPGDRRSIRIGLTQKGKLMSADAARVIAEANREFLSVLDETERRELHHLIGKLRLQATTVR